MVYVFLADGFEEIEALAFVDILRRAGIAVKMVSITEELEVSGALGIKVTADATIYNVDFENAKALVLPGGMPGAQNLSDCNELKIHLVNAFNQDKYLGAICAAPMVLGRLGLLKGKEAICYDGYENELDGATISSKRVAVDGNIITAVGAGAAHDFAFEFVKIFKGEKLADAIRTMMKY